MKLNFPASGPVIYAKADNDPRSHFVLAPLVASFLVNPAEPLALGQPHTIFDESGTRLTYRVTEIHVVQDGFARAAGELIAVEHVEQGVISQALHDEKISTAIDEAFQAGKEFADGLAQAEFEDLNLLLDEPSDILVTFADGSNVYVHQAISVLDDDGHLSFSTTSGSTVVMNSSWRSYELVCLEEDTDLEPATTGETAEQVPVTVSFTEIKPEHLAAAFGAELPKTKEALTDCPCEACAADRTEAVADQSNAVPPLSDTLGEYVTAEAPAEQPSVFTNYNFTLNGDGSINLKVA